jgi:predicted permease
MDEVVGALTEGSGRWSRLAIWLRIYADVAIEAMRLRMAPAGRPPTLRRGTTRHGGGSARLDGVLQDVRFATRSLARRPGFASVTVLILALGIGSSTTIFSVVNGVLLRPLPYHAADRIGILWDHFDTDSQSGPLVNPKDIWDYRRWSEAFEGFTYGTGSELLLATGDDVRITDVAHVEAGFFEFFGHQPALGRSFMPEDDRPESAPVAVLSDRLWREAFAGDPSVLGRTVELGGRPHEIVGVLSSGFRLELPAEAYFLEDAEIWTPARIDAGYTPDRTYTVYTAFGRIRSGLTFEAAQQDLDRMMKRLHAVVPEHARVNMRVEVVPLHADVVKHARPALSLLFAAVGLVLLVSCANVASLLVARGHQRRWEISIRRAIGAGHGRLFSLVLIESAILAAAGGVAGSLAALLGLRALRGLAVDGLPLLDAVRFDGGVLAFAVAVSAAAALTSGLFPAARAAMGRAADVLSGSRGASAGRSGVRFRNGMVVAEVALSLVLLVGAGLLVRSFLALRVAYPGFATEGAVTFRVALPPVDYPSRADRWAFYTAMKERLEALPGVESVAATSQLPLTGRGFEGHYAYDERTAEFWGRASADGRWVSPGYFRTIGATLLEGREYTLADVESGARVLVIDERLARQAFGDRPAVGQLLQTASNAVPAERRYQRVIGVVQHLRLHDLTRPGSAQIYAAITFAGSFSGRGHFSVVVRSDMALADLAPLIRQEVRAVGSGIAVQDLASISSLVESARAQARVALVLMLLFGVTALVLSLVGLYAVLAAAVSERTKEIGIRIALGQDRAGVQRLVIAGGMRLVIASVAVGLVGAALGARAASSLLFEVTAWDLPTYLGATALLAGSATLACWLPARRAARVDPIDALRVE